MARTKQTARKSTGGKVPRMQLQGQLNSNGDGEPMIDSTEAERENEDRNIEEELLLAESKDAVLESLSINSTDRRYFEAILLLHRMKDDRELLEKHIDTILNHAKILDETFCFQRAIRLKHRLYLILLECENNKAYDYLIDNLGLSFNATRPDDMHATMDQADENISNTFTFDIQEIIAAKVLQLKNCISLDRDGKVVLSSTGESLLHQFSAFTRENIFRKFVRGEFDSEFPKTYIQCIIDRFLSNNLLSWTDFPEYIQAVGMMLQLKDSSDIAKYPFGSQPWHTNLTLSQLDALWNLHSSDLSTSLEFALQYIIQLRVSTHSAKDSEFIKKALASLEKFTISTNVIRFVLLYNLLRLNQYCSDVSVAEFESYLLLPRMATYLNPSVLKSVDFNNVVFFDVNSMNNYPATSKTTLAASQVSERLGFDQIDEAMDKKLIKDYASIVIARNLMDLSKYLEPSYYKTLRATILLTAGLGSRAELEADIADVSLARELFETSSVAFAEENPKVFAPEDPVSLLVKVVNTKDITVQLFELNVADVLSRSFEAIQDNVSLDGLLPNEEYSVRFDSVPSHVRVDHRIEFPTLQEYRRGVFVVEVVSATSACRAIIRKGHLRFIEQRTLKGHTFRVLDETNALVPDFIVSVPDLINKGQPKTMTSIEGVATLPYFTPVEGDDSYKGSYPVYVGIPGFGVLGQFTYSEESYQLNAKIAIDTEQLVPGKRACILTRAIVYLHEAVVPSSWLQKVCLVVEFQTRSGTVNRKDFKNLRVADGNELSASIDIPQDAVSFKVAFSAEVANPNTSIVRSVDHSQNFELHTSTSMSESLYAVHLKHKPDGTYWLLARGHNGEIVSKAPFTVQCRHSALEESIERELVSNAQGEINLGTLEGIEDVRVNSASNLWWKWILPGKYGHSWLQNPSTIYTAVYTSVELPLPRRILSQAKDWLVNGWIAVFKRDLNSKLQSVNDICQLSIDDTCLTFTATEPGNVTVVIKPLAMKCAFVVSSIQIGDGFVNENTVIISSKPLRPVMITSVDNSNGGIAVKIRNATPSTRVHVVLRRFLPASLDMESFLGPISNRVSTRRADSYPSSNYFASKRISDEYAYVLGRRAFVHANPTSALLQGSQLPKPSLLINPFSVQDTTSIAAKANGDTGLRPESCSLRRQCAAPCMMQSSPAFGCGGFGGLAFSTMPNTSWLADPSIVLTNLRVNHEGNVNLSLESLNLAGAYEVAVMVVNGDIVATEQLPMNFGPSLTPFWSCPLRDVRLSESEALDKDSHYMKYRGHQQLSANEGFDIACTSATKVEIYDSIEHAFQLFNALTAHNVLNHDFLLTWGNLTNEKKAALYTKHASDELNVFLLKKDPTYFNSAIAPHLRSKFSKTFIDYYLLNDTTKLEQFTACQAHLNQLSIIELLLLAEQSPSRDALCQYVIRLVENYYSDSTHTKLPSLFEHVMIAKNDDNFNFQEPEPLNDALGVSNLLSGLPTPGFASAAPRMQLAMKASRRSASDEDYEMFGFEESSEESSGDEDDDDDGFEDLGKDQKPSRTKPYKVPGPTKKLQEKRYHDGKTKPQRRGGLLSPSSAIQRREYRQAALNYFWRDYAQHLLGNGSTQGFTSTYFPEAHSCFAEILLALAVLDLPLASPSKATITNKDNNVITISAGPEPILVYYEDIQKQSLDAAIPEDTVALASNMIVTQTLFYPKDSDIANGILKPVATFVCKTTYGCQVTVSNLSPLPVRDVQLLLQIPQGAIPVKHDGFYTRSTTFDLGGNETETVVFFFYFPSPGRYGHFGAHVAIQNFTVRWAQGSQFDVVERIHTIDSTSWNDVSTRGSLNDVLAFLSKHAKLETLDLTRICWRLKARESYDAIIAFLRSNFVYDLAVFQYAFYHKDPIGIRDVLQHSTKFLHQAGPGINGITGTITVFDGVPELAIQSCLELAEFTPYIIRRVHPSNTKPNVNKELQEYYQSLCAKLALLPSLHSLDYLVLVYFLVVFNRVDTALACFARINKADVPPLQYDYMAAYLSFYGSDSSFSIARSVATSYRDYVDPTWRERFRALGNQLKSLDALTSRGPQALATGNVEDMTLTMTVHRDSVLLEQKGTRIASGTLRFYPVDVEVMFSTNPFAMKKVKSMPLVQPRVSLPVHNLTSSTSIAIPDALQSLQMLVAFTPDSHPELEQMQPHFCDSMDVDFRTEEGYCQVFAANKPLPRAYVKVFAQTQRSESYEMYKDGYTDVCGCFEYMGINDTKLLMQVTSLSILILHKEHGAVVRQLAPPTTKTTIQGGTHLKLQREEKMVRFLSWLAATAVSLSGIVLGQSDYPLCGVTPYSYTQAASTYPKYKEALQKHLSNVTIASWYTDNDPNSYTSIQKLLNQCGPETLPVIVVYGLPNKDCSAGESNSGSNKNADAYSKWIQQLADLIDTRPVIYVMEPDAVGLALKDDCGKKSGYIDNMSKAIPLLSSNNNSLLYVDVGYWMLGTEYNQSMVKETLKQFSTDGRVTGIALDTSNYRNTSEMAAMCESFGNITGNNYHCVIDTSRNYRGPKSGGEWCNSRYAAIGVPSTNDTANNLIDYFLWLKTPGESDGACKDQGDDALKGGGTPGQFFDKAFSLMWDRGYFVDVKKVAKFNEYSDSVDLPDTSGSISYLALGIIIACCVVFIVLGIFLKRRYDARQARRRYVNNAVAAPRTEEAGTRKPYLSL